MKKGNIHALCNIISGVISIFINILRRGSPGLLTDHASGGDLLIARIQPSEVLQLS
jgi:hypothetical protein